MVFRAKLRRGLPVWTAWRHRHATAGVVAGVRFRWCPGDDYATDDLSADEVRSLHGNAEVLLECFGTATAPSNPASSAAPDPASAPSFDRIEPGTDAWRAREAARKREWRAQRNLRQASERHS